GRRLTGHRAGARRRDGRGVVAEVLQLLRPGGSRLALYSSIVALEPRSRARHASCAPTATAHPAAGAPLGRRSAGRRTRRALELYGQATMVSQFTALLALGLN